MKKYKVIYADPPWNYRNKKTGGNMSSGASQKYPTLTTDQICSIEIPSEKDSVLFLWVTCPMMEEGLRVMNAWGYKYKTKIYWRKIMSLGMGFWYRGQVEELWLCIKGNIKAFRMQEANFIQTKALKHSHKPTEFRELIERSTKGLNPKLELFATEKTNGWDVWGDEVESNIDLNIPSCGCDMPKPKQKLAYIHEEAIHSVCGFDKGEVKNLTKPTIKGDTLSKGWSGETCIQHFWNGSTG